MILPKRLKSFVFNAIACVSVLSAPQAFGSVLFAEDFENQPDYTATMHSLETVQEAASGFTIPDNWTAVYQGTIWSPETGYPDHKATIEILAENGGRRNSTRSYLGTRESIDSTGGQWHSDGQLIKAPIDVNNPEGTEEIYIEFWIRFDANWYQRGFADGKYPSFSSKIFRISSWTPGGNMFSGAKRDLGPVMLWDYKADNYGMRNKIGFRGGPPANLTGEVDNYKAPPVYSFTDNSNFNKLDLVGEGIGGSNPKLPDLVHGGLLADTTRLVTHEMLWGPPENWTKVAFYLKMNSAPGVPDGIMSQFINDHRIRHEDKVPWVEANPDNIMVKWNHFSIGGNDQFLPFPAAERFEDYYYIDDVVVRDSLPAALKGAAPQSPVDVEIK